MDDEADELQVEFIPAYENAKLRLECIRVAHEIHPQWPLSATLLDAAQQIYSWVMEEPEAAEEQAAQTPEGKCERRH